MISALARATGTFLAIAFAIIGIALVAFAVFARPDAAGVTRIADRPVLTVLSDSMTPTFAAGDLLIGQSVDGRADKLEAGTVITFRAHNGLVTHRIVGVEEQPSGEIAYRTQGDANNVVDATLVAPDEVVGAYSWHIPNAGYVLQDLRTPKGISALVLALLLFLLAPLFVKWWRSAGEDSDGDEVDRDGSHGDELRREALEPEGVS